jgi:hypothetical protein
MKGLTAHFRLWVPGAGFGRELKGPVVFADCQPAVRSMLERVKSDLTFTN